MANKNGQFDQITTFILLANMFWISLMRINMNVMIVKMIIQCDHERFQSVRPKLSWHIASYFVFAADSVIARASQTKQILSCITT